MQGLGFREGFWVLQKEGVEDLKFRIRGFKKRTWGVCVCVVSEI